MRGFMSADDLRSYMTDLQMAKASKVLDAMDKADEARKKLVSAAAAGNRGHAREDRRDQAQPRDEDARRRPSAARRRCSSCASRARCAPTRGRAINNAEPDWPATLTGRPRQAFEFWKEHLQPAKYKLRAMIIDWPGGLPGDIAFFLKLVLASARPREENVKGHGIFALKNAGNALEAMGRPAGTQSPTMSRRTTSTSFVLCTAELVKLQEWAKHAGAKVCIVFEGRDGAGKGGVIKAITERVSPRVFRVIALPPPTEREKSQMYVQRYLPHLPAAGRS